MAITFNFDMFYTRAGEGTPSDVLSAHNPLIWLFRDSAIAANPTATVDIVVKNNAGATIYTSDTFSAYLTSFGGGIAVFRFDASQIIKHIINTYFYKETSDIIEAENYGSEIEVTIKSYDDAVLEDTEVLTYFASHALNQIGDEYGTNIPRLFYNDTEEIAHFLGFPNHIFFHAPATLTGETPLIEVSDQEETANLISSLANDGTNPYDTFTTSGTEITSAIASGESAGLSVQQFNVIAGEQYVVLVPGFVLNSGDAPLMFLGTTSFLNISTNFIRLKAGDNAIVLSCFIDRSNVELQIYQFAAGNWSCDPITIRRVHDASSEGTLGLFMHDAELSHLLLDEKAKLGKIYYDLEVQNLVKEYNITVLKPCDNSVLVRWLNINGLYSYFALSPFPTTTDGSNDIGKIINSFSLMALANARHYPIGKRDAFRRLIVAAAAVPIVFRRMLMQIFLSPAVYLWQGKQTLNGNLLTGFINSPTNAYDSFSTFGVMIYEAFEITGNIGQAESNQLDVYLNISMQLIFFYSNRKSASVPTPVIPDFYLVDADTDATISNVVNPVEGPNTLTITPTVTTRAKLRINTDNVDEASFSTGKVVLKYAEVETDWILLEGVEGSHNLREKKGADNFIATLILPERYTQQLAGQNL